MLVKYAVVYLIKRLIYFSPGTVNYPHVLVPYLNVAACVCVSLCVRGRVCGRAWARAFELTHASHATADVVHKYLKCVILIKEADVSGWPGGRCRRTVSGEERRNGLRQPVGRVLTVSVRNDKCSIW